MAKQESIGFLDFKNKFNREEACREHLFKMRWPDGFKCPRCGHDRCYVVSTRNLYECTECHYQASVTAGTVMDKTRIKLQIWFWAIYLVGKDKRGISATMLSRELGLNYKSAWFLLHRIRKAMADRDSEYNLSGIVELDDAYFGSSDEGGKRGRGTDKAKVVVGLSLNSAGRPQYIKMQVVDDLKRETIAEFAHNNILAGSTISSDAYRSYYQLIKEGYKLEAKVFNPKENPEHLKWLHTIVSNAKAFINGTFHGLDKKHLQQYLDEFCFRFNRRWFGGELFNRIVNACIISHKITYAELTA